MITLLICGSLEFFSTRSSDQKPLATINTEVSAVGYVEPVSHVRRLFFSETGIIAQCCVKIGQQVQTGDLLSALSNETQEANLRLAREQLKVAEADAAKVLCGISSEEIAVARAESNVAAYKKDFLRKDFARVALLYASNTVAKSEFELAETALMQSEANWEALVARLAHLEHFVRIEDRMLCAARIAVARANVEVAQQRFESTFLRAQMDGTILDVVKWEGETALANDPEPVIIFGDTSALMIRAEVDERFAFSVRQGQTARVFGYSLGTNSFKGTVETVKKVMGRKTVFTRSPTERKDLDSLDAFILLQSHPDLPVGLRVDVAIEVEVRGKYSSGGYISAECMGNFCRGVGYNFLH